MINITNAVVGFNRMIRSGLAAGVLQINFVEQWVLVTLVISVRIDQ